MSDHSQHSDAEMNYSNMSGDINASEDDEVAEELSEVKLLMSTPNRICAFVGEVIKNVLLTTDKVEDIAFEKAPTVIDMYSVYFFGIFRRLAFGAFFLYFTTFLFTTYYSSQPFVAVEATAGNCKPIFKSWTIPTIPADYNGYWEGQLAFQSNQATYLFSFFEFPMSQYEHWLSKIEMALLRVGETGKRQDLAHNLLYWSSWLHVEKTASLETGAINNQILTMNANPRFIMNNEYTQSTVANIKSDCPFSFSATSYSLPDGRMKMSFDVQSLSSSSLCNSTVKPGQMGYDHSVDGQTFTITLDVNSLFSAMVVANSVNGPNSLDEFVTLKLYTEFLFAGVEYQVYEKFDGMYPAMMPIYCIGPKGSNSSFWNCLLRFGDTFGIPFFVHAGGSLSFPQKCDCSTSIGQSAACNQFNFLSGVIVHDYSNNRSGSEQYPGIAQPFLPAIEFFYVPPVQSASVANQLAFYPAWAALFGQDNPQFKDSLWRENAYDFTKTKSFGYGSLIIFQSFTERDWSVSENKFQLRQGSCADSFSTPNFQVFKTNPWGSVHRPYFECTKYFSFAMLKAVGLSAGTAFLVVPVAVMLIMFAYLAVVAYWKTDDFIRDLKGFNKFDELQDSNMNTHFTNSNDETDMIAVSADDAAVGADRQENSAERGSDEANRQYSQYNHVPQVAQEEALSDEHNFAAFHKRRMRELLDDETASLLTPKDLTELILAEWLHRNDDQNSPHASQQRRW